jgi:EAL domain-containing protein (putative c-di-GMP-specific phosphodiesterase class I)
MDLSSLELVDLVLETPTIRCLAEEIIPNFMERSGATGGSILVESNKVLKVHTAFGLKKSRSEQAEIPLGVGITGQAAESGELQWIPDVRERNNFIEGVPESTWEFTIPIHHENRGTSVVIDLESNTEKRPSKATRQQIKNDIESIKLPLLTRAENERFRNEAQNDKISSLMDGEYFFDYLNEWISDNPSSDGLLMILELEPRMENPKISSLRDLRGEVKTIGSQIQTELSDRTVASRLFGNLFCLFFPSIKEFEVDEKVKKVIRTIEQFCCIKQFNFTHWKKQHDIRALVNKAFVELNFTDASNGSASVYKLDKILQREDIQLSQQPILNPRTREVFGREILVRGPQNSDLHSPKRLFEAAYQQDRVVALDTLIIQRILNNSDFGKDITIFLNVERKSLVNEEWRNKLIDLIKNSSRNLKICVEITEHGNMKDLEEPLKSLRTKVNSTVQFAVDDFGTGSSNFETLIDLNPAILKIDRSLIRNIDEDFSKRSFVDSILNYSSTTSTKVLAEGIEDKSELNTLKNLGVDLAQGYFFSKPEKIKEGQLS